MNGGDEVVDKALELGTTFFRNENYPKAKEIFKKAFKLVRSYNDKQLLRLRETYGLAKYSSDNHSRVYHPKYVRILDNLAATYEKTGELDTALKYAQRMLAVEPSNLKCYIRFGKILQKQGKDGDALDSYDRALGTIEDKQGNHVDASERFVAIIEQQKAIVKERLRQSTFSGVHDKNSNTRSKRSFIDPIQERKQLSKRLKRSHCEKESELAKQPIDFVDELPFEVLPLIFRLFSTKELMRLALVCKTWRQSIRSLPEVFQRFILNRVSYRDVLNYCEFMHLVYFKQAGNVRKGIIELIKFSCKTPSEEFKSLDFLMAKLQDLRFRKVILSIPNCNTAHFTKCMSRNSDFIRGIEELSVVLTLRQDKPCGINMLNKIQNLKRLEILLVSSVVPVTQTVAQTHENDMEPVWADKIESFKLICSITKIKSFPFFDLLSKFPSNNLSSLCITGVIFGCNDNQFDWLRNFRFLKEIWFEGNKNATLRFFMRFLRDFPFSTKLSKLTFREDRILSRFDMEEISSDYVYCANLKNLCSLDIMGTSISGLGLMRLISYFDESKMKKINFGDCPFIKIENMVSFENPFVLPPSFLFTALPQLEDLIIPQLGTLNDQSMSVLRAEVNNMPQLKRLDLALNPSITGVAIYDLLKALKDLRLEPLDQLNIDGCAAVSHITIGMLKSQGLIKTISCSYERELWRKFGINSFIYKK